jgi:phenylalanyl-tRNA synthetase beta chain
MSLSMTKEKYAQQFESVFPQEKTIRLKNALSSDLALMRTTLLFGGLESIALNVNHRNNALRLFETGRAYSRNDEGITETEYVGIWLTGRREMESWNNAPRENNFQDLLATIENITKVAGLKLQMNPLEEHPIFSGGLFWSAGPQTVIAAGLVKSEILDSLEIAQPVYYAEIDFDLLFKFLPKSSIVYKEPSKYPSVRRDLSLTLDKAVSFAHIKKIALETEKKSIVDIALFDVYEGKNLPEGKKSYAVSFILQDESKTMNDHQVNGIMERIQKSLSEKLGAELRT